MQKKSTKNIRLAFLLNFIFAIIELVGGFYTNSIAIITDSLHDFGDSISILVSWGLERKSERQPNKNYTYGYGRFSVLGALICSIFLLATSIIAVAGAIPRLFTPADIDYNGVLILAVLGFMVNGVAVLKTSRNHSLNERAISLHMLEDVLGWAAVLVVGIVMKIFNLPILDPILSILIAIFISFNVLKNIKKIFEVFLEKSPTDINMDDLKKHILSNNNIRDIHHIHLWSLDGVNKYITLHAIISKDIAREDIVAIKSFIKTELAEHGISHSSIEIEFEDEECDGPECHVNAENTGGGAHFGHNHNH
ncbi:MAG: cation diffusion facilitator family transporter [Clostridiales bacterium]|jgi:cobalt-zinc-cadmium efflux system protein|nr:cation diffusion facilitator family transporter [Clostridiales bacterium]